MRIMLYLLTALLVACGGSPTPEPVPEVVVPIVKPVVHAHLYGDSTQAWNPHTGIESMLPPGSTVQVSAWPGLTAIQHLYGEPAINVPPFQWSVENCNCTVVVVNYGINDAAKLGVPATVFYGWIDTMRNIAKTHGKDFVWETPNPILAHPSGPLLGEYAAIADGKVADVYGAFVKFGSWESLMADAFHPNVEGYTLATQVLAAALSES